MKGIVCCFFSFFVCTLTYAQHISEFASLIGGAQDSGLHLPASHTFQYIIQHGDPIDVGGSMPDVADFTGYVPRNGSSKYGYLSINSEARPGAVTILDIEFDDEKGQWIIDNSQSVEFNFNLPAEGLALLIGEDVGSTIANCSGTVTPWNTIITCEEVTNEDVQKDYPLIRDPWLNVDGAIGGYHGYGWAIEIDPVTKTVIDQDDTRDGPDKLWAMGNFKHENVVIHSNLRTVYEGADDTSGQGYLFKFVATNPTDLSDGDLFVYSGDKQNNHEWVKLKNTSKWERNNTLFQCDSLKNLVPGKATSFGGIEDVEINPVDGMVYFAVKQESIGAITGKGVIYRFKDIDPLDDSGISDFEIYAGGNSVYDGEAWGYGNDNLVFDDLGNLWVAQDGNLKGTDNNYIWVVENGHTQDNPKVKIFAKTPKGSEPTGMTFSPDFRYMFMSIQHPDPGNNSTSQTDAAGNSVAFDADVTLVIARSEYLGKDLTQKDQDLLITQYFHDDATGSNWIEIKNISGKDIPAGSYFIDLYDGAGGDLATATPKASESIPLLKAGEVLLFKNSPSPSQPNATSIGNAIQIQSSVCDFDGDDVIMITTTPGSLKYINRKDILGNNPSVVWGQNTSLIRGGNSSELPERDFEANNWIELDAIQEINQADKLKNIALGTHVIGPAVWNGASWENNSPADRTRNTEINGDYFGGKEEFVAYDLIINETGSLKFEENTAGSNNNIIVYGNLTIDPKGSLVIGDTESLIIKNVSAGVTGSIEKIEKSSVRNHPNDITYWSSPVQGEQIENVFPGVNPERIFYYDQSKYVSDDTYWDVWVNAKGSMEVGKGYIAEGPSGETGEHEISFRGKPNYGAITTSAMQFNNDEGANENIDNDFNLIGNPYPSAIDIETFLETNGQTNGVIDGTVYLWTHATAISGSGYSDSDYVTYNYVGAVGIDENTEVGRNIGSGQGFFVRALKPAPVVFDQSMIIPDANDQFFKSSRSKDTVKKDRMWINLKGSDQSFKQILIGFSEAATEGMDPGYDAIYLDGGRSLGFYSLLNDQKLAIQGLGAFESTKKIDLGFNVEVDGLEMTLQLGRVEGVLEESDIILIDHELGVMHDLKQNAYQFSDVSKGQFDDRFSIIFNKTLLLTEEVSVTDHLNIHVQDQKLLVSSQEDIGEIRIYDALGRLVISGRPGSKNFEMSLDEIHTGSFFIVQIWGMNRSEMTKKMIKY